MTASYTVELHLSHSIPLTIQRRQEGLFSERAQKLDPGGQQEFYREAEVRGLDQEDAVVRTED